MCNLCIDKETEVSFSFCNAELMLLGFISLLITVGTKPVSKICISAEAGSTMLPCKGQPKDYKNNGGNSGRKLLWHTGDVIWRRALAVGGAEDYCSKNVNI